MWFPAPSPVFAPLTAKIDALVVPLPLAAWGRVIASPIFQAR